MFTFWPHVTQNVTWPPPQRIAIIFSIRVIHISSMMRSLTTILHEVSCLQGFDLLTSCDHTWTLTSIKTNRGNLLNMGHLHGKYEVSQSYPSCLQANVKIFTVWPLLTPNDCLSISIKTSHSYSFWDLFTSVTYMHTHTTLPLHRFILSPAWTQTHTHTHLTTCIHTHTYKMTVALMNSSRSVT